MHKLKAPEGVTAAAVESTQYEVDEHGHVEVENGEHIPHLKLHGFVDAEDGELSHSDPADEPRVQPDFSKFVNKGALIDYLKAHGQDGDAASSRADLEAACVACFESGAERVEAEAVEQPEVEQTEEPEGEGEDEGEGEGEGDQESVEGEGAAE
jgi:hypothetical protein